MDPLSLPKLRGALRPNKLRKQTKKIKYKYIYNTLKKPTTPCPKTITKSARVSRTYIRNTCKQRTGSIPTRQHKIRYECFKERACTLKENDENGRNWIHPFHGIARKVPTTMIKINGIEITCTVDTGATRIMMTSAMAAELSIKYLSIKY